jgi:hypothetical protein
MQTTHVRFNCELFGDGSPYFSSLLELLTEKGNSSEMAKTLRLH